MKFYILLFLIYVGCEEADQEEPTPIFIKTFGGSLWDYGNAVHQTNEGGYIIIGETSLIEDGTNILLAIFSHYCHKKNQAYCPEQGKSLENYQQAVHLFPLAQ